MKIKKPVLSVPLTKILCLLAGLYAIAVAAYIFTETGKPLGARDFHQFWYAGHFILQGHDPYEAFFNHEQPHLPVHYLNGVTVDQYPVAQPKLEITPSNTPTMLLLLSPLAQFSWSDAKWSFMFMDLILMLITGWLVLRYIPFRGIQLSRLDEVLIFLIYFDLSATRIAIENGQTTLLVFLLMLLTLITIDRAWHISGVSLGLALSKYSLSLPIVLFFLYKKKYKSFLLAIFIQLLGVLGLSAVSHRSPVTIIYENIMLFFRLFNQPGIHLSRWFEFLSTNHFISVIPALIMTALVFIPVLLWTRGSINKAAPRVQEVLDFHILTILFIWTMLVAYHRLYDTLILLFFVVLIFKGLAIPAIWKFTDRERKVLLTFMAIFPFIFILPARIVDKVFPEYYGRVSDEITTFTLVIMLGLAMWLLHRSLHNVSKQAVSQTNVYDTQPSSTASHKQGELIIN
jgi:hypothetical protein